MTGISVIICCFNSESLLAETLKHIATQHIEPGINCEIILVDNASNDNTRKTAQEIWAETGSDKIKIIIEYEPLPGLTNARKKGISASHYEYLIFCDDDNRLDENYVQNVFDIFNDNPEAVILGGSGIADFEDPNLKPVWFDEFYQSYAIGKQANVKGIVNGVYGAGMAARRSVLTMVINNLPMFLHGRKKNQLTAGEDGEICYRVSLAGYQVLFAPQLTFKHFLTNKRLSWTYLKKMHVGFAKTYLVLNLYKKVLNNEKINLFYWLKQGLYFAGIYLKYWPRYYFTNSKKEGDIKEIHLLTWKNIALSYFKYNFKTFKMYTEVLALKTLK